VHEGVLLDWTTGLVLLAVAILRDGAVWCRWGDMGDFLGIGVLATDLGNANVSGLASFGERIVAAVKVLALLRCG
jgi:hypothetical protein